MEKYDRNRIHSESMEFVGLIADKVNTINTTMVYLNKQP